MLHPCHEPYLNLMESLSGLQKLLRFMLKAASKPPFSLVAQTTGTPNASKPQSRLMVPTGMSLPAGREWRCRAWGSGMELRQTRALM